MKYKIPIIGTLIGILIGSLIGNYFAWITFSILDLQEREKARYIEMQQMESMIIKLKEENK